MIEDNEFLEAFNNLFEKYELTMPELMDHMANFFGYYAAKSGEPLEQLDIFVDKLIFWANKYCLEMGSGPLIDEDVE